MNFIDKVERLRQAEKLDRERAKERLRRKEKARKKAFEQAKDARGRFLPDLGKPTFSKSSKCRRKNLKSVFYREVKGQDWKTIIKMSVRCAKEGCHLCRDWLGKYIMGKPPQFDADEVQAKDSAFTELLPSMEKLQELAELEIEES